jgi:hypothetical protein
LKKEPPLVYDLPNAVYFFTNRVELGSLSVYKELDLVSKLHGAVTEQQFEAVFGDMKRAEGSAN